jgi:hypothetical protein
MLIVVVLQVAVRDISQPVSADACGSSTAHRDHASGASTALSVGGIRPKQSRHHANGHELGSTCNHRQLATTRLGHLAVRRQGAGRRRGRPYASAPAGWCSRTTPGQRGGLSATVQAQLYRP